MSAPRLTIGMATMNDFDGVYFTIMAINAYHRQNRFEEIELIVVDQSNSPGHQEMVKGVCAHARAHYIPFPSPAGTSQSRNEVFRRATGDFVLCIDSHVLLLPRAIERLLNFIPEAGPHIYSGPLIMDSGTSLCTHFNPFWRGEMFGVWGRAWQCKCGEFNFTTMEDREPGVKLQPAGMVDFVSLEPVEGFPEAHGFPSIKMCHNHRTCGEDFPRIPWAGHEAYLLQRGFKSLGIDPNDEPFEIPGMGLGVFGCRRDSWLGFHLLARGFGAEELNVHELFRHKGRKAICLPFLQWHHRFGRPAGVPYRLDRYDKARNYVLWHQLLGKPLDDIKHHFVDSRLLTPDQWDYLLADPEHHTDAPNPKKPCTTCGGQPRPEEFSNIEDAYQFVRKVPRDFDQHMPKLRELADQCEHVTEFSIRRESCIALCASKAKTIISRNSEQTDPLMMQIQQALGVRLQHFDRNVTPPDIFETDLLFLNTVHTGERVMQQLQSYAKFVKRYIVLHNTQIYGERGEDGQIGIMVAARGFMRSNPEWSVVYHTIDQYGLTVLSRLQEDKKQLPGLARQAVNFSKALAEHVADGLKNVPLEIMENRLNTCMGCPQRNDSSCAACGCSLDEKTKWASSYCPLGFWPNFNP